MAPSVVPGSAPANRYTVSVRLDEKGWNVAIASPDGSEIAVRASRDEHEARMYASTVRQHIEWLSELKFREYYRLEQEV